MDFIKIFIDDKLNGLNIEEILSYFHLGKDKIKKIKSENVFYLDDEVIDEKRTLYKGNTIKIAINEKIDFAPLPSILDVAYEDEYFLIVNKPRKMLIHPDGVNKELTLVNLVSYYFKTHHINRKIRFCNRLDYDTEGLVIFCKDYISQACIDYLIESRKVTKKYYAVCYNRFSYKDKVLNLPIARDRHTNKMRVAKHGKESISEYHVIKNGKTSLVEVNLHTGRTHQIRVHMAYINHPLVGDNLYGNDQENLLGLQAYLISFSHPFINKDVCVKINLSKILKEESEL